MLCIFPYFCVILFLEIRRIIMKKFIAPEVEVVRFNCADVITTSLNIDEGGSED